MSSVDILNSPSITSCLKKCQPPPSQKKEEKSVYSEVIKKFMKKKDVPLWYKELSERQMTNANELLNNLRDDTQQETTHRTKLNLQLLGICPMPTTSQIKVAMQWSQGNDLAFLWFLLELYYAKREILIDAENSVYDTNQQIIMSTIVHLDMCPTLRELDRILPKQNIVKPLNKTKKPPQKKIKYSLPYLEPIRMPIPWKKSIVKVKEPPPKFYPYDMYLDPNYISPNEINRWYADPEQVCNLFDRCDEVNRITDDRKRITKDGISEIMCDQYTDIEELRKTLTYKLKLAVKRRCEIFLKNNRKNDEQRDKFIQQLENDIKNIEEQFYQLSERFKTQTWLPQLINELLSKTIEMKDVSLCNKILTCAVDPDLFGDNNSKRNSKPEPETPCLQKFDYGHYGKLKPNEKYFSAPTSKSPFKFDYERILNGINAEEKNKSCNKIEYVKNAVKHALDFEKYGNEDKAVLGCLDEMWDYELQEMENNNENNSEADAGGKGDASLKELIGNKKVDPKNSNLMDTLLQAGIKEMKKNSKFVMVQLPQIHKLQILQLWIRARYGYVITQKQRDNALRISKQIVEEMRRIKIKIPFPKNADICKNSKFSFLHKDFVTSKAQYLMHSYFGKLKARILNDTQIYWYCMEPTHCKSGPPREVFFSYLPAKPQDILPFRPWQSCDFVDVYSAHKRYVKEKSKTAC